MWQNSLHWVGVGIFGLVFLESQYWFYGNKIRITFLYIYFILLTMMMMLMRTTTMLFSQGNEDAAVK